MPSHRLPRRGKGSDSTRRDELILNQQQMSEILGVGRPTITLMVQLWRT
jgi:hypothetical protein